MADFCITDVRYNDERSHITYVKVREEKFSKIGLPRTVSRAFVADLIRLQLATFQTRVWTTDGKLRVGAHVHVIDEIYLTTDQNSTTKDNLGSLPEF